MGLKRPGGSRKNRFLGGHSPRESRDLLQKAIFWGGLGQLVRLLGGSVRVVAETT